MKILEINKFHNAKRGADKHFLDVVSLLENGGHQVATFSMNQTDDEKSAWGKYFLSTVGYTEKFSAWEKFKGIFRMFYSFEAHRKIKLILDDFQPDIVHVHNIYHQMDPTILFEIKKRNIPIVMTVHDFKLINPNHSLRLHGRSYRRCSQGKYYQCFLDKCVKNSYAKSLLAALEMYWHTILGTYSKNIDLYLTPSEFAKEILVKWGMPADKIKVLPHFMPQTVGKIGRKYSFSVADSYALYAGKISKEKGVDTLLEIFKDLKNMKLYLAGEVEAGFALPRHHNIVPLGFVPADQLSEYIRNSKCMVSGSKLPETFGLIALEAMTGGKPFVSFAAGAYGEVIESGRTGYIAKDKKEMADFLQLIAEGKKVFDSEELKKQAEKYDAGQYERKITGLFQELVAKKD